MAQSCRFRKRGTHVRAVWLGFLRVRVGVRVRVRVRVGVRVQVRVRILFGFGLGSGLGVGLVQLRVPGCSRPRTYKTSTTPLGTRSRCGAIGTWLQLGLALEFRLGLGLGLG